MTGTRDIVLTFEDARRCVEQHASLLIAQKVEVFSLNDSAGRVLAENILADRDFPPFPRATRDGYALRASDLSNIPAKLRLIGQIKAGGNFTKEIGPGECVEIMTGAAAPGGTDAVVMVEHTSVVGDFVEIHQAVYAGENIVPIGSEGKAGQLMVKLGTRMSFRETAVAAAVGKADLRIFCKPRIAILSTGDEVVDIAETPGTHQIRNSNAFSVAHQVRSAGGDPVLLPIAPDRKERLQELIAEGLKCDLLLITGGVSMGKYDLVEKVLQEFKSEFFFTGAKIQPGKPVVFGRATYEEKQTYFVGLPGNPVSTMVTFELFASPLVDTLCGAAISPLMFAHASLRKDVKSRTGLTRFLPAFLSGTHSKPEVELVGWQGSADILSMTRANCYLVVPPDRPSFVAGDQVSVLIPQNA